MGKKVLITAAIITGILLTVICSGSLSLGPEQHNTPVPHVEMGK